MHSKILKVFQSLELSPVDKSLNQNDDNFLAFNFHTFVVLLQSNEKFQYFCGAWNN